MPCKTVYHYQIDKKVYSQIRSTMVKLSCSTVITLLITSVSCNLQPAIINPGVFTQSSDIGECQACRIFVESFKKGLERTARGKYEGGDAAWEEEKLKVSYKRSEMRLIDIQEGVCKEETKHGVHCYNVAEKAEEYIEQWWAQNPDHPDDLFEFICIDKLKVCCPKHHYGKHCAPCLSNLENICNRNGKCRGDGTRKGNGTCACFLGYIGENCENCHPDYFETIVGQRKLCGPCHTSCLGGCRESTPKDCVACKPGYVLDSDDGCTDINECDDINVCSKNMFCVNNEGSYECLACDKACNGCHADGPDMCRKCAKGYTKKGEMCIADREDEDVTDQLSTTRYMTYLGLLAAIVILLPTSTALGCAVGMMVLSYMVAAEYYCMINGHTGLLDLRDYDLMQLLRT